VTRPGSAGPGAADGRRDRVRHVLRTALFASLFWLVLSGHYEPLLLGLGVVSVAVVCWLTRRAGLEGPVVTVSFVLRLLRFLPWLSLQVLVSAWAVTKRVWSPRSALSPVVEHTSTLDVPELSQVVYANSITLTPGTLSMDVDDGRIEVHSLGQAGIEELREGSMLNRVRGTEGRP
jgi:multicomponent Na+:H+ antiporter subunit E